MNNDIGSTKDDRTHEKQLLAREIRRTSNKHSANTVPITT